MHDAPKTAIELDPSGFNELKMCRSGPMLYNKNDIFVGGSLQAYGEFSVFEQELFAQIVKPGDVVVEVGANIGAHTVELSRSAGPKGAVLAFEPQRLVFQALCANLALNQCTNVYAQQIAVGASPGWIVVPATDPTTRTNFGGVSLIDAVAGERVMSIMLDSLELPACKLLKADVEGMELEVVRGALGTIRRHRPVLYLENDRQDRSPELLEALLSLDYAVYWHVPPLFNPKNFFGVAENIWEGDFVSVNVLCVPGESPTVMEGFRRVNSASDHWQT